MSFQIYLIDRAEAMLDISKKGNIAHKPQES